MLACRRPRNGSADPTPVPADRQCDDFAVAALAAESAGVVGAVRAATASGNRRSAASVKVGTPWTRRSPKSGSPPDRANLRLARASAGASGSETSAAALRSNSRRRPPMTSRWIKPPVRVGWSNRSCQRRPAVSARRSRPVRERYRFGLTLRVLDPVGPPPGSSPRSPPCSGRRHRLATPSRRAPLGLIYAGLALLEADLPSCREHHPSRAPGLRSPGGGVKRCRRGSGSTASSPSR